MAKDDKPDQGEKMMDAVVDGKTGLESMDANQLAHLGGTLDPIDTEDFSDADFGNVLPDDFDDRSAALAQNQADIKKDDDDADADKDKGDDADAEADADADTKDSEDKADADSEGDDADADTKADDDDDKADADTTDESDDKSDAAKDESEDEPAKKREQQIPKSRFDEVNTRRKAAEEKLAALEAEKKAGDQAEDFNFDEAELEFMDLLLAGKTQDALVKRNEIRAAEQSAYLAHANAVAPQAVSEGAEQAKVDALVDEYEVEYNGFNPKHDDYQADLMDEVASMYSGYMSHGFTRSEAFKMALDNTVTLYKLPSNTGEPVTEETTDETKPKSEKKPIKKTKEKLEAAKNAPADPSKASGEHDDSQRPVKIEDMSDEELAALPPAALARLRGDTI
jgi:hypothetical protein